MKLSRRPLQFSYTDLVGPTNTPNFDPLVAGDLALTAYMQNPLETANTVNPITAPSDQAISVVSVPTDGSVTGVQVYFRVGTGPAKFLAHLTDQTGGVWSVTDQELISLDYLVHGAAPWTDIQFKIKFVNAEGVAWAADWVDVTVSQNVPATLPGWTGDAPWSWDGWGAGGYLADCTTAVGDGYQISGASWAYGSTLTKMDLRIDCNADPFVNGDSTPPATFGWHSGASHVFILGFGIDVPTGHYWEWYIQFDQMILFKSDALSSETEQVNLPTAGTIDVERAQFRCTVDGTAINFYYRNPYSDADDRLPLDDDTRWKQIGTTQNFTFAFQPQQDTVGVGVTHDFVDDPIPEYWGAIFGYRFELNSTPDVYAVHDMSLISFSGPTSQPDPPYPRNQSAYTYTDSGGKTNNELLIRDEDNVAGRDYCFTVTWG
jgi:hypothetical protein